MLESGGGRTRLYTWPRVGVADEAGSHTRPDAAGGEAGHGAAKLDPVIHRFRIYRFYILAISDVMRSTQKFVRRRPVLQRPFDSPHYIYNQQGMA